MSSIRLDLLKWLIAPLLILNLIGAGVIYKISWRPAQTAFDQSLADAAWAIAPRLHLIHGDIAVDLPQSAEQVLRVDHFDSVYLTVRDAAGRTITGDKDFPSLQTPLELNEPIAYDGAMRGDPVRIIALKIQLENQPIVIGVAETLRKRSQIQFDILMGMVIWEGVLTLISIGVVWLGVSKGLFSLRHMQTELGRRERDDFSPVSEEKASRELLPLVRALNALLDRTQTAVSVRQDFLANVAHQLRTPLAGLKTQIELLQQRHALHLDDAHSLHLMMGSVMRMIRQSNQLLALARAEPSQFEKTRLATVRMDKLVEESIQHFVEQAHQKHIDLGFNLEPIEVKGDRFLLRDLIDNLIDNAIRYTPAHGTVTVSTTKDKECCIFSVEDSGPGIALSERELIFNRFYRLNDKTQGSGLGLAIVRDIANDHNAEITLATPVNGKGTIFSVLFM